MIRLPSSGPTTADSAQTLARYPCTLLRCAPGKRSATTVMDAGWMAPAPLPCNNRKTIIEGIDQEQPASADAERNSAMPKPSTGLRPYMSASLPNTPAVAVWLNRNDEKTREYRLSCPSCAAICGIAVDTIVASTAIMAMLAMIAA